MVLSRCPHLDLPTLSGATGCLHEAILSFLREVNQNVAYLMLDYIHGFNGLYCHSLLLKGGNHV